MPRTKLQWNRRKHPFTITWVQQRFRKNLNWLGIIVGPTGSSKSYSALTICKAIDPTFNVDRVVFDLEDFIKLITGPNKLPPGSMILFDEAGVSMDSRSWFSLQNKAINYILQTFRKDNLGVIFTVPDIGFIDKNPRKLFHTLLETRRLDRENNKAKVKWLNISVARRYDKTYYLDPRYCDPRGKHHAISFVWVHKPPKDLIEAYETKKGIWLDKLKAQMEMELRDTKTQKKAVRGVIKKLSSMLAQEQAAGK